MHTRKLIRMIRYMIYCVHSSNKQTRGKFNNDKLQAGIRLRRSRDINGQTYEKEVNYEERY